MAVTLVTASGIWVPFAFQFTVEPPVGSDVGIKVPPVEGPEIVSVTPELPGAAEPGAIEETKGRGLGGGLMIKARVFDRPLFWLPECGLRVLILALPGLAISAFGTTALRFMTLEFASRVGVVARLLPFHWATVWVTNGPPNRVIVRSEQLVVQALTMEGEMAVRLAPVFP